MRNGSSKRCYPCLTLESFGNSWVFLNHKDLFLEALSQKFPDFTFSGAFKLQNILSEIEKITGETIFCVRGNNNGVHLRDHESILLKEEASKRT